MRGVVVRAAVFVVVTAVSGALAALVSSDGDGPSFLAASLPAAVLPVAAESPIVRNQVRGDLDLSMVILPGLAGENEVNFYMIDLDRDWKDVTSFGVTFDYLDGDTWLWFEPVQLHEGHFPIEKVALPYAGSWRVDVAVQRAEAGTTSFGFDFKLSHR
jgi:hypothetical protein